MTFAPISAGRRMLAGVRARKTGTTVDEGSAVVEFALVSIVLVMLLLAVLQVAVYLHVHNVVTASAAEGARWAANSDVDDAEGGPRAREVIGRSLGKQTSTALTCTASDAGRTVAVRCSGRLPVFFAPIGRFLPLDVTAHSFAEGH